jgi:hypothetical protein
MKQRLKISKMLAGDGGVVERPDGLMCASLGRFAHHCVAQYVREKFR